MRLATSASALMFDYILTGPISSVSAGQYMVSLALEGLAFLSPALAVTDPAEKAKLPGLADRLTAWLPSLVEHRCGVGEVGGDPILAALQSVFECVIE